MKTLTEAIRPTVFLEPEKLRSFLNLDLTIATETFQYTGSFKFRAAYNLALQVPNDEILTASSGNFGQALAYACKLLKKKCTVVMPETSARVKIEAVKNYGATVDLIDTKTVGRGARVAQLADHVRDPVHALDRGVHPRLDELREEERRAHPHHTRARAAAVGVVALFALLIGVGRAMTRQ